MQELDWASGSISSFFTDGAKASTQDEGLLSVLLLCFHWLKGEVELSFQNLKVLKDLAVWVIAGLGRWGESGSSAAPPRGNT